MVRMKIKPAGFDILVLGAGAAGCAAARALAAKYPSASIALLEAGARGYPPAGMRIPFFQPFIPLLPAAKRFLRPYLTLPVPTLQGRRMKLIRGRGLGGTSLIHDMTYRRGSTADFAAWSDPTWTFESLLPYWISLEANTRDFHALQKFHGSEGPLLVSDVSRANREAGLNVRFFEACEAAGLPACEDFNTGPVRESFSCPQSLISSGVRVDVFDACVEVNAHRTPQLQVYTGVHVRRLVCSTEAGSGGGIKTNLKVIGVEVCQGKERVLLHAPRVVSCLGVIGSVELLLRSGIGPDAAVWHLPGVGQHVIQGTSLDLAFELHPPLHAGNSSGRWNHTSKSAERSKSFSLSNLPFLWREWRTYQEERTGVFASFAEALAFVSSQREGVPGSDARGPPDLSLGFFRIPQLAWRGGWRLSGPGNGFTLRLTHHYPVSRGSIQLDPATQRLQVQTPLLNDPADRRAMDEGLGWVGLLVGPDSNLRSVHHQNARGEACGPFAELGVRLRPRGLPYGGLTTPEGAAAFLSRFVEGSMDMFGGCAMHAVVDNQLRVRGVDGVWIADTSVVPAPTMASSVVLGAAIGARVAEFVPQ